MSEPQLNAVCGGGPREMGLAQGVALRDSIAAARAALAQLEAFRLRQPRWLPYLAYRHWAQLRAARFLRAALRHQAPAMGQRLAGLAEGARTSPGAMCLFNALEPFMASVADCTAAPPLGACSAVAVRGRRSAGGEPIIARNFDYLPLMRPFYALRACRPQGGLAAIEFIAAPLVGAIDGINERGLAITYNYAFTRQAPVRAPSISMAICEALHRCSSAGEAVRWIASQPRSGAGILMLADAEGDLVSLELAPDRHHARRPAHGEDALFHTNHFSDDGMRQVEVSPQAVFTSLAPTPLRGRRPLQSAVARSARLGQLLAQTERYGPADLALLMSDHGPLGQPSDDTLCMHGSYWHTTACVQLLPRMRRLRVAYATACQAEYVEFEVRGGGEQVAGGS